MALRINSENRNLKRKIELSVIDRIAKKTLKKLGTSDAGLDIIFVSDQFQTHCWAQARKIIVSSLRALAIEVPNARKNIRKTWMR